MSTFIRVAVSAFIVTLFPAAAFAQMPGTNDPDYKEVLAYRLSVPALAKVVQATRNLSVAIKSDPRYLKQQGLMAEIKKLEAKDELSDAESARLEKLKTDLDQLESSVFDTESAKSLSGMAAQLQKEPVFAKALADAGLPARDYAKFVLAYFQAAMVHGMMKSGLVKEVPKELAATVNMENVKLVGEHEAELAAFAKEMQALGGDK